MDVHTIPLDQTCQVILDSLYSDMVVFKPLNYISLHNTIVRSVYFYVNDTTTISLIIITLLQQPYRSSKRDGMTTIRSSGKPLPSPSQPTHRSYNPALLLKVIQRRMYSHKSGLHCCSVLLFFTEWNSSINLMCSMLMNCFI